MKLNNIIRYIHVLHRKFIGRPLNNLHRYDFPSENNGWLKNGKAPVWGNVEIGTMFDPYATLDGEKIMMVVSARKERSIILIESSDGMLWERKQTLLNGSFGSWDTDVNRGCLLNEKGKFYLWYTGQYKGKSSIGLAMSDEGTAYTRVSDNPILESSLSHEGVSAMNPCVIWDDKKKVFRMWYSAGDNYEPDVICYAESKDGINWKKNASPVLTKYPLHKWEKYKVGGCQVVKQADGTYLMYYIGYQNVDVARVCVAYSKDGIKWDRDDNNLLIAPSKGAWDADATYKPTVVEKDGTLYMWYNGRKAHEEYIGLATKTNDMKYDYLIVGSGLFGATFAYRATKAGKKCLVIDKRPQLGGNVYCEQVEGINVHKYGAHIFHTSNKEVWDFVNSIVEFNRYTNCPVANYKGELYNLPFNMNTFNKMWSDVHTPAEAQARIDEQKAEAVAALGGREPQNLEEQALTLVGKDIFQKLIKEYTEKQWGRDCKELPAFIIKRLPVRMIFDNNYFNDKYQGIPVGGYNKLIDGLLEGVETKVNFDFFKDSLDSCDLCSLKDNWQKYADKLVYTGAVDEYFNYSLGKLDWRTVSFKTRVEDTPNYQGNAVVNYTSHNESYTRVIEHKHFEMFGQEVYDCPKTVVSEEYSTEYKDGMEPYYPVNDDRNNALAEEYRKLAEREENVIFGGRLGQYKYYDMAPVIEQVLKLENI